MSQNPSSTNKRVAVIGSGISGLAAAWHLAQTRQCHVTLYESDVRAGGHAHTVDVTLAGKTFGVDTGFLVFNHKTYPGLTPFFNALGVPTTASDMGFSVQVKTPTTATALEWAGNSLSSVFTQRKNLLNPRFWRMLRDLLRFNKAATAYALNPPSSTNLTDSSQTLGAYLQDNGYSDALRDWYLIPMAAAIWSCPTETMLAYPMATFARFCHNHGLLQITNRPQWYTVTGGSREYVARVLQSLTDNDCELRIGEAVLGIEAGSDPIGVSGLSGSDNNSKPSVRTALGTQSFDAVIVATHSDQALRLLGTPTPAQQDILGAIRYQPNVAVLHTDASVLPSHERAWAAWNYETFAASAAQVQGAPVHEQGASVLHPDGRRVCLHYLLNKLQPLPVPSSVPVLVTLNPITPIDPAQVIQTFDYDHPVFDAAAIAAQQNLRTIQGSQGLWFAGAWTNYGFHEDGFQSGMAAARAVALSLSVALTGTPAAT
jgi:uncharacterized protein